MITHKEMGELFNYVDGELYWKNAGRKRNLSKPAGHINKKSGYRQIGINRKHYEAHQLVWIYFNEEPPKYIDHINHIKLDNRIENLRSVTSLDNQRNMPLYKTNTSGFNGVRWVKRDKRWAVTVRVKNAWVYLGYFRELEEAISMRLTANDHYGFHENHGDNRNE